MHSPPSPSFDVADIPYADAPSGNSPSNGPTRGATINRRLPQLPQSPPPAVPDGSSEEEKDPDYDQTYDVIPEKRKQERTPVEDYEQGGGYERLRDTSVKGASLLPSNGVDPMERPYAKVNDSRRSKMKKETVVKITAAPLAEEIVDPNYNSIEETRGEGGGTLKMGLSPLAVADELEPDGHYASVGGKNERSGGELMQDDPYARVNDREVRVNVLRCVGGWVRKRRDSLL